MTIHSYLLNFSKKYIFVGLSYFTLIIAGNVYNLKNIKQIKITNYTFETVYSAGILSIAWPITVPVVSVMSQCSTKNEIALSYIFFLSSICGIIFCIIP